MTDVAVEHALFPQATGVQVLRMLAAQLGVSDLMATPATLPSRKDQVYRSNAELWDDLLSERLRHSAVLRLPDFWLSEWFPLSPGLFHTAEAARNRDRARGHLLTPDDAPRALGRIVGRRVRHRIPAEIMRRLHKDAVYVYDPYGKGKMLEGGVGSVRLKPKEVSGALTWFMGASSTGVAHEGIPVGLPDTLYAEYIDQLSTEGAIRCTFTGRLKFLPQDFDPMFRDLVGVPQVYILVEQLEESKETPETPFLASGAVMVETGLEGPPPNYFDDLSQGICAAYVSFLPAQKETIDLAAEWLADTYVRELLGGRVLTDFDEQVRRFPGTTFSLDRVMDGRVAIADAEQLLDRCAAPGEIRQIVVERIGTLNLQGGVVHQTRTINIGAGATVNAPVTIADSIQGSFNRVEESNIDASISALLRDLAQAVVDAAQEAPPPVAELMARDIATLTTELTSETPRPRWYRLALDSLRETASTLGAVATPILDVITKLAPLV